MPQRGIPIFESYNRRLQGANNAGSNRQGGLK
jgi:hypothetical protein